jgi:hypothetical protein
MRVLPPPPPKHYEPPQQSAAGEIRVGPADDARQRRRGARQAYRLVQGV